LRKEWTKINAAAEEKEDEETRIQCNNMGKLRKGLRTPESSYVLPILQALDQMGGSKCFTVSRYSVKIITFRGGSFPFPGAARIFGIS